MSRRLALAVVVLVVIAGCSGAGVGGDGGEASSADQAVAESDAERSEGSGDDGGDGGSVETGSDGGSEIDARAKAQSRLRIRTARVELEVASYEETRDELVAEAQSLGGYVDRETSDRHSRGNESWMSGTLVLRVPSANYDQLLGTVESSGTVRHKESKSKDVTEQVVDLRARLRNLEAQRDRLRDLYDSANETEEILRVGQRLSEVQGEIERVEGKLEVLENQVAYSTVRIELSEERPEGRIGPEPEAWYETGVLAAFLESINGVVVVGRMFVVGAAYLAPYALAFGIPVAGLYVGARRFG